MSRIDTSIEGYRYIGINLTQEQLRDLFFINSMMREDTGEGIPVHCVLLVLKCLGMLPSEMMCDTVDGNEDLERKFGRMIHKKGENMKKNNIFLHNENGITQLNINGAEVIGVSDYKIVSSANGKTELTFTICADSFATELEIDLAENLR